jgi:hypothetical protein
VLIIVACVVLGIVVVGVAINLGWHAHSGRTPSTTTTGGR